MARYLVIIEQDETGGCSAWAPDLPGVVAAANSYDECLELMHRAVRLHLGAAGGRAALPGAERGRG